MGETQISAYDMTTQLILDISPELEARLRADAEQRHLPIELLAVEKLDGVYSETRAQRLRALASLGTYDTRARANLAPTTEWDDDRSAFYDDGLDELTFDMSQ